MTLISRSSKRHNKRKPHRINALEAMKLSTRFVISRSWVRIPSGAPKKIKGFKNEILDFYILAGE